MAVSTALENKYRNIRDQAMVAATAKFPHAEIIISFGAHDCIVDVLDPDLGSKRFVFDPEDD